MEEAWSVPDVYLLAEGREGAVAVPNLSLTFGDLGLALDKADGEPVWSSNWVDLQELSASSDPSSRMAGTASSSSWSSVETSRRHRFVLASNDIVTTEAAIRGCAGGARRADGSGRRAVSPLLTVSVAAAALATLAVLLLSAAHVITF